MWAGNISVVRMTFPGNIIGYLLIIIKLLLVFYNQNKKKLLSRSNT